MGSVYRVRNLISDREEALKVLIADVAGNSHLTERFYREIKVQASLSHPHIAGLHTAFRHQNQLLMVMELIDGETLEQKMQRRPLAFRETVIWTMQLLSALDYSHRLGVVHRDIKPANIMVNRAGAVKLLDFGIAARNTGEMRLTASGTPIGTVRYMSPEQIQAQQVDGRSDLYSTGIVLYEALTGRRPFDADNAFVCMQAHLTQVPDAPHLLNPDIPLDLSRITMKALEKDAASRFESAYHFGAALAPLFHHYSGTATATGSSPGTGPAPSPSPSPSPKSDPAVRTVEPTPQPAGWDPAVLEKARQDLAQFIGPMARVLVKRTAPKVDSPRKLYETLALEISDEADRKRFLALGQF